MGRCIPQMHDAKNIQDLKDLTASLRVTAWGFWCIHNAWAIRWVLAAVGISAILMCFFWTFSLTFFVMPIAHFTLAFGAILLGGSSFILWQHGRSDAVGVLGEKCWWCTGASIVLFVAFILYLLLLVFMIRHIHLALDVIKIASKVVVSLPHILGVPFIGFVVFCAFTLWWFYVTALLSTSAKVESERIQVPFPIRTVTVQSLHKDPTSTEFTWMLLFGYLWGTALLSAITYMVTAFIAVFWYFSVPGDDKYAPKGTMKHALVTTFRYHLGTLALGSLFLAIVQMIRIVLHYVEKKARKVKETNQASKFLMACSHCCLNCIERFVKFVDHNAYIVTCVEGTGFCSSIGVATHLIIKNLARVGALNFILDFMLYLMKFLIAGSNVLIAWFLMTKVDYFGAKGASATPGASIPTPKG